MRVCKHTKPERLTKTGSVDEACYVKLQVDGDTGTLVATNGDAIVHIPCVVESGDESGLIPHDAFRAARMTTPKSEEADNKMHLKCGKKVSVPTAGQIHDRPQVTGTLFGEHETPIPPVRRPGAVSVSIDAHELMLIADAMATKRVTLSFVPSAEAPVRVEPAGESWAPGAVGALLPPKQAEPKGDATATANAGAPA